MKFNKMYCFKYKDNFNLSNRIKQINKNYELFFNAKDKTFIIANNANNYEICLNFNNFNQNIENLLKFTKVENSKNIFNFLENENKNLINKTTEAQKDLTKSKIKNINYFSKRTPDFNSQSLNKYLEVNDA